MGVVAGVADYLGLAGNKVSFSQRLPSSVQAGAFCGVADAFAEGIQVEPEQRLQHSGGSRQRTEIAPLIISRQIKFVNFQIQAWLSFCSEYQRRYNVMPRPRVKPAGRGRRFLLRGQVSGV